MEEVYLECDLGKGMFSNERSFSFKDYRGRDIEGFYPASLIHKKRLRVTLLKQEGDLVYVHLHQSPIIDEGSETQIVARGQITYN